MTERSGEFVGHTPGPWEIVRVGDIHIGVGERINAAGKPENVFRVIGNTLGETDDEGDAAVIEANSKLIAAAPELLRERDEAVAELERLKGNFESARVQWAARAAALTEQRDRMRAAMTEARRLIDDCGKELAMQYALLDAALAEGKQ